MCEGGWCCGCRHCLIQESGSSSNPDFLGFGFWFFIRFLKKLVIISSTNSPHFLHWAPQPCHLRIDIYFSIQQMNVTPMHESQEIQAGRYAQPSRKNAYMQNGNVRITTERPSRSSTRWLILPPPTFCLLRTPVAPSESRVK